MPRGRTGRPINISALMTTLASGKVVRDGSVAADFSTTVATSSTGVCISDGEGFLLNRKH